VAVAGVPLTVAVLLGLGVAVGGVPVTVGVGVRVAVGGVPVTVGLGEAAGPMVAVGCPVSVTVAVGETVGAGAEIWVSFKRAIIVNGLRV